MPTTCLICCQEAQYFLLPPCNHKQMCWKCCSTLIQGSTFSCPYCKGTPQGTSCILFVNQQQMNQFSFQQILRRNPYKSAVKSYQFYSNQDVANFIEQSTSIRCRLCLQSFSNINIMKKHLNQVHRKQFCDVCLQNRKCLISQQKLYNEGELHIHKKKGEHSSQGQLILYHPQCYFCKTRFYDIDSFKAHLRISTHLRCHICQQNYPKFKYVYYKDYMEIQKHFYKSHYVCQLGNCLTKKLQNVYVSKQMLQQHQKRVHSNKNGTKSNKPVTNLILFRQDQNQLEWDKIGKDLSKQFMILEKQYVLQNQQHFDKIIDIRQFYNEQTRDGNRLSLQQISERLGQFLFRTDYKSNQIKFTSVPLFCPLNMNSLMRTQLQKFVRGIYEPRLASLIVQIFFTRKFQYKSQYEFFQDLRRKMSSFSPISYYYIFPQLIRFYKDTNPTKKAMDQYYAESLRSLQISNLYIFHKKQRYSQILNILIEHIQSHMHYLMIEQKIDLGVYTTYLKDLNPNFYNIHHQNIFYVQRQKVKNMYHMIKKTKNAQLLKFGWLVMLGVTKKSYKILYDKFFYKPITFATKDYDMNEWVTHMSIQELAIIHTYLQVSRQSFINQLFEMNKQNPNPVVLGNMLSKIKPCMPPKQFTSLRQIQIKAMQLAVKLNNYQQFQTKNKKKGTIINEEDCPSLLDQNTKQSSKINENQINSLGLPWQNVSITNNSHIRVNKKNNNADRNQNQQQFPQLQITTKNKAKTNSKGTKKQQQQEEQFPIFDYKQKKNLVIKKSKKNYIQQEQNQDNIKKYGLFNKKNAFPSQKLAQNFYQQTNTNKGKQDQQTDWPSLNTTSNCKNQINWDNNQWPTLQETNDNKNSSKINNANKHGNKTKQQQFQQQFQEQMSRKNKRKRKKLQQPSQNIQKMEPVKNEDQQIPLQLLIRKKTKQELKAQQQMQGKKSKVKNNNIELKSNKTQQASQQKKQKQQTPVAIKPKKHKVRLDMTDSEQQVRKCEQQKKKEKQQKHKKFLQEQKFKQSLKYNEGFQSLQELNKSGISSNRQESQNNNSIINKLIQESKKSNQVKAPEIIVKKGKKGKAVIIERVDLSQL